jgi:membrane-associated protease RseP (regulator of RpoE activity)
VTQSQIPDTAPPPAGDPRGEIAGGPWRASLLGLLVLATGYFGGLPWLVTIAAFLIMIFLHELGHYLTAKWSGMKVTEFFLFFGPKLWSFRRGETEYGIKLIPLGAYVRIIGMSNMDNDVAPEDEHRTYRQQSYPKRLLVVSAGSLMHFLQALVLFFVAFSILGVSGNGELARRLGGEQPPAEAWVIGNVSEGSGAEAAGLQPKDKVLSISGDPVATFDDVGPLVRHRAGDTIPIVVQRDGKQLTLEATLTARPDDASVGFLGIGPTDPPMPEVRADPVTGAIESVRVTALGIKDTTTNLVGFFTHGLGDFSRSVADGSSAQGPTVGSGSGGSSGPRPAGAGDENRLISLPGVARIGAALTEEGMGEFLVFLALINLSLGVLNLLPLLPLDGGHVAIATYERIRSIGGRRHMADVSRLIPITYAVVLFFVLIGVSSIYLDFADPIGLG